MKTKLKMIKKTEMKMNVKTRTVTIMKTRTVMIMKTRMNVKTNSHRCVSVEVPPQGATERRESVLHGSGLLMMCLSWWPLLSFVESSVIVSEA